MYRSHRLKLTASMAALLFALGAVRSSDGALIRFRSIVEVKSNLVTLGDVADVLDNDESRAQRLKQIALAPAPPPGREIPLDFAMIRSRLQARGVDMASLEFSGNSVVTVRTPAPESSQKPMPMRTPFDDAPRAPSVSESHIRRAERLIGDAVRQALAARVPDLGEFSLSVEVPKPDVPLVLAAEASGYQVLGGGPPWDSRQAMTIRLMDRNEELHDVPVAVTISKFPYVVVARYSVSRGQILQASDVLLKQTDDAGDAIRRIEYAVGKEVKSTIHQGAPILRQNIREQPLIRNNDIVTVTVQLAGIRVQRQFRARSDGAMGDTVTLLTLDGREQVMGRVTGYHEAAVLTSDTPKLNTISDDTGVIQFVPTKAEVVMPDTPETTASSSRNYGSLRYLPNTAGRLPRVIDSRREPETVP